MKIFPLISVGTGSGPNGASSEKSSQLYSGASKWAWGPNVKGLRFENVGHSLYSTSSTLVAIWESHSAFSSEKKDAFCFVAVVIPPKEIQHWWCCVSSSPIKGRVGERRLLQNKNEGELSSTIVAERDDEKRETTPQIINKYKSY